MILYSYVRHHVLFMLDYITTCNKKDYHILEIVRQCNPARIALLDSHTRT